MAMNDLESAFVEKRRRLIARWRYGVTAMIVMTIGLAVWLWLTSPMLINPYAVMAKIENGTLTETGLLVSAVILPLMTLIVIGLLIVVIVVMCIAVANERKLIEIIDRTNRDAAP